MPGPILSGDANAMINAFILQLKSRRVEGSMAVAKRTIEILRIVISQQRIPTSCVSAGPLLDAVKAVGLRLIAANPLELGVGNIVRRVLHIIREEEASLGTPSLMVGSPPPPSLEDESQDLLGRLQQPSAAAVAAATLSMLRAPSLTNLLEQVVAPERPKAQDAVSVTDSEGSKRGGAESKPSQWRLKHNVIDAVNELLVEVQSFHSSIAEQAMEHIHQNEVIMTWGRSKTVVDFLMKAGRSRAFQVMIAEGQPRFKGNKLARELACTLAKDLDERWAKMSEADRAKDTPRGIVATVITDSAVFALMARVNMVIVGARAVMADGGVIVNAGVGKMALAAHKHGVPFVVLAGLHKLCPEYPHDPDTLLNEPRAPANILNFGDFSKFMDGATGEVLLNVVNPAYDYIPPEYINLFITDTGGHKPSYVYRLVAEYYSPADFSFGYL